MADVVADRVPPDALLEIEQLLAEFTHRLDRTDASTLHELFTEDGRYALDGSAVVGRDEIRAGYARRASRGPRTTRHVFTPPRVRVVEPGLATANSLLVLYGMDGVPVLPIGAPLLIADVDDRITRAPLGWRFADRTLTTVFRGQGAVVGPMSTTNPGKEA